MKKIFVFNLNIFIIVFLTSCGYNTKDWPRLTVPVEREYINYVIVKYEEDDLVEEYKVDNQKKIDELYIINIPYRSKSENYRVINGYFAKLFIEYGNSLDEKYNYDFIFYLKGISNNYVDINSESLHFLPADLKSYYKLCKKIINGEE